jgi:hypothetical protein
MLLLLVFERWRCQGVRWSGIAGGLPPGRGRMRLKPCAVAEGWQAGPMYARTLAFRPFAP